MDSATSPDQELKLMTVEELSCWLESNGIPEEFCKKFEDNYIDGAEFNSLTESEIREIIPPIGLAKKIIRMIPKRIGVATTDTLLASQSKDSGPSPIHTPRLPSLQRSPSYPEVTSPVTPRSPLSPLFSASSPSPAPLDSEDAMSMTSIASTTSTIDFSIPNSWPPSIMSCIQQPTEEEQRRALGPLVRNEIVRVLATQMFCFDPKPKKEFCTLVAKKLVKKYRFMKDVGEKVTGYGSWEKKLIEKVHNIRGRLKRPLDDGESTPKAKRGRPKVSQVLTRYPPMKDTGDDDVSVQRNTQQLAKELDKEKPRKEIVLTLARHTYTARRANILSESADITASSLLTQYNELKKSYVLEQEMDLILEKRDVCKTALQDWTTKWVPAILQYAELCTGRTAVALLQAQKDFEGGDCKDEKVALAILCKILPKKGTENAMVYVYEECKLTDEPVDVATREPKRAAPRVACFPGEDQSQYFLYVESEVLCITHFFSQALMLWFIAHYVFNLEYCPKVKEVALFMQEFVFKLPATSGIKRQKTATYLTVTTDIQNCIC